MASFQGLTPDTTAAVNLLLDRARVMGLSASVRSSKRDCRLQNQIYAQGRTAPGAITTYAQGCHSWHVLGRAVDITIAHGTEADYARLAQYWKGLGGKWGGDFPGPAAKLKDVGHYEWHPDLTIADVCLDPKACKIDEARNAAGGRMPVGGEPAEAPALAARAGWGAWLLAGTVLATAGGLFWATTHMKPGR
jgi:hypothetical protein